MCVGHDKQRIEEIKVAFTLVCTSITKAHDDGECKQVLHHLNCLRPAKRRNLLWVRRFIEESHDLDGRKIEEDEICVAQLICIEINDRERVGQRNITRMTNRLCDVTFYNVGIGGKCWRKLCGWDDI